MKNDNFCHNSSYQIVAKVMAFYVSLTLLMKKILTQIEATQT